MSIRKRLIAICLAAALLPAIPLSFLVSNLIEKSFGVGLSGSVSEALEGGMAISRRHLEILRREFAHEVETFARLDHAELLASGAITMADEMLEADIDSGVVFFPGAAPEGDAIDLGTIPRIGRLIGGRAIVTRRMSGDGPGAIIFYETDDRSYMLAAWAAGDIGAGGTAIAWRRVDREFLKDAGRLLDAGQGFAGLRFAERRLTKSFLYSFLIIYAVVAFLTFLAALALAERIARPVRRLSEATSRVADGDWDIRIDERAGGEMGRLVSGFNAMVGRLDAQRRRLIDVEKMASWRDFARHLAHEIKNPILPIRLTVQELKDRYRGEDKEYGAFLEESSRVVEEELEHLQRLVREFSSFAKMPGLSPVNSSLEELIADVAGLYGNAATRIESGGDIPRCIFDADQMRRVLVNLFDNAIAVGRDDGTPSIVVRIARDGDEIVMNFTDDGPGIPKEDLEKVFEPYFTTRPEGSGLGLAMVKSIVLMHGGTIAASNNGGAQFTIRLPIGGPPEPEHRKE